jgi:hypothetical protein
VNELSQTEIIGETPETLKPRIHGIVSDGTVESAVTELAKFAAGQSEDNSIAAWVNNIGTNRASPVSSYITGTSLEISGGHNTVLNPEYAFLKKQNE